MHRELHMGRSELWRKRKQRPSEEAPDNAGGGYSSVRSAYEDLGAQPFYAAHGKDYSNPHEAVLSAAFSIALDGWHARGLLRTDGRVLDLACGGGEATMAYKSWLAEKAPDAHVSIEACDPYTAARYAQRTGVVAESWSFSEIADGQLDGRPPYELVIASFCLHLLEDVPLHRTLNALKYRRPPACKRSYNGSLFPHRYARGARTGLPFAARRDATPSPRHRAVHRLEPRSRGGTPLH